MHDITEKGSSQCCAESLRSQVREAAHLFMTNSTPSSRSLWCANTSSFWSVFSSISLRYSCTALICSSSHDCHPWLFLQSPIG